MNLWKVILVTLVIFSTGVITGTLVSRKTPKPGWEPASTNRPSSGVRPDRRLRMEFITRAREELQLTPQQFAEIEEIVTEGQTRMSELWEEFSPQMRGEFDATQDRIREVLTPGQLEQFEELIRKRRSSRHGDRDKRRNETNGTPDAARSTEP